MDDSISRQAAIDELIAMREHIDARMSVIGCTAYEMAIEALRQPEREKGKWILVTNGRHECNKCHLYAPSFRNGGENLTPYCPICGADMRGEMNEIHSDI